VLHHIKKHNKQKGMNTDSQTQHNLNVAKCLKDGLIIGISKQYAKLKLDGKGRHPYLDIKRMQVSNPGWLRVHSSHHQPTGNTALDASSMGLHLMYLV